MEETIKEENRKKVLEERMQTWLFIGLALFVLVYPLAKYIWPYYVRGNQLQEIFLLILMIYFICVLSMKYRVEGFPMRNIITYALAGMILCGLISCVLCGNLTDSVYGDEFQGEGYIVIVAYYTLFLAAAHLKKQEYRRWLLRFLYLVLAFIIVYGILQYFHVPFMFHNTATKAAVLPTRNQNFYAAFPILFLGVVFGKLMYGDEKKAKGEQCFFHILAILGFGAGICADSLVFYAGLIMQFLLAAFLCCFGKKGKGKTLLLLFLEFIVVFFLINGISGGQMKEEVLSLPKEIAQEGSLFGDTVGTLRMHIWKVTLRAIPRNWAFGCGIECSYPDHGIYNAHNEYLHIWAEQGTFAIIAYLVFLFALFIPGILQFIKKDRYESDFVSKAAMFAFFGYIAQAFANIRVVQVAPYFWLCCGLLYVRKRKKNDTQTEKHTA